MTSIVVATRNEHKLEELREILDDHDLRALPLAVELPPEEGGTFAENALVKARAAASELGVATIGEDSGVVAAALDGRPGVHTARFAGPDATDEQNLSLLLAELEGEADRSIAYVCALAYVDESGSERVFEGRCSGHAAYEPRGRGGFGYDPIFVATELDETRTMAELSSAEKHSISHRGRAARALRSHLTRR